jgi:LmbE family N-acetylglucosaminyl deacetylase
MSESYGLDVLAFGPPSDDVELFCGGLLARMAGQGYRAGIVDLTRGEKSSRGTPETRARETEAASQALGLALRENLGLPDGWLSPWAGFDAPEAERAHTSAVARETLGLADPVDHFRRNSFARPLFFPPRR